MKRITSCFSLILVACVLYAASIGAQELVVAGTIASKETGEALPGANILVVGTQLGTSSDANGKFRLNLKGLSRAKLIVSFIGYKTDEVEVAASTQDLGIILEEDVLRLSGVVVTGLATSVAKRNLANAVATVSADELVLAPAQTVERALTAKFAGINVSQNSGAPGGGIFVDLRGVSTIEGNAEPLYVIDGVIVNNAATQSGIDIITSAPGVGNPSPQGIPVNRIADLNPNDIESVEVLKGASAAAVYGAKASNGVIIITTKQGVPGRTKIDVTQQIGFNTILRKMGTNRFTAAAALAVNGQRGLDLFNQSGGRFIDQEEVLYGEEGLIAESSVNLRGGTERTQFYASGLFHDEDGIVKNTGYKKYAGRVNVNHKISERLRLDAYANFIRSESDRGVTGNENCGGCTYGGALSVTPSFLDLSPRNGVFPDHPFASSNPLHTAELLVNNELVNRTVTSFRLNYDIARSQRQSLAFIAQAGADFYAQENKVISPPELQFERVSGRLGTSMAGETESTNSNLYLNLVHDYAASSGITLRTSGGAQFENQNLNNVLSVARGLISTQQNVDQAASINAFQERAIQRERGFFVQEEVNLKDKIFLTAGVRGDASSANGDVDKYFLYPKASASLRLSQYAFWQGLSSLAEEFKLRVAYGETGNLAPPNSKYISFVLANIGGSAGSIRATRRGNPNIEPERTKELEFGFDATLFSGRANLEFTYYRQNISELLLISALPPSSGFVDEFINGGKMRTTGFEVSLGLNPIRRKNLSWTSRVNFYTTNSEITELKNTSTGEKVAPFNKQGYGAAIGRYRIQEGLSPTTIIGAETDAKGNRIPLGDEIPDFQMSFNNNLNLGSFELSFLWDWKRGGEVINLAKLLTDLGGTTPDYASGGPAARLGALGVKTAQYVEDGTYLKLREASLSYSFGKSAVNKLSAGQLSYLRIGVAGRNLLMSTDYDGYDPEVSTVGNVAIGRSVDVLSFPSARSFYFNLAFGL